MNSELTPIPPDDPEVQVTALLLGELTPEEAAKVQVAITQDPALAQLHDRLKRTIGMVREVQKAKDPALPRLSENRRQKLLSRFKVIAPPEMRSPRHRNLRWLIPLSAAAALVVLLVAALLPSLAKAKAKAQNVAMFQRQREELARRKLSEEVQTATNASGLGRNSWAAAREIADRDAILASESPATGPAAATRRRGQRTQVQVPLERTQELDRRSTFDTAGAVHSAAKLKPEKPATANQIFLPATEPPTDEFQTPVSAARGGEVVNAPATVAAAPARVPDIRMMTRYGLSPRGLKAGEEARPADAPGLAEGRQGLASIPSQPLPSLGTTEGAGLAAPAPAQSKLAPLPLKLPAPAFVGTPTDIPVETDHKERLAEANGVMAGGRTFVAGAGGYGGFGGGGLAGYLVQPAQAVPMVEQAGQAVVGQTLEANALATGSLGVEKRVKVKADAAVPAAAAPTVAGLSDLTAPAAGFAIAPANGEAALDLSAAGAAKAESNRGRAGGSFAVDGARGFAVDATPEVKTPVLGDIPTVGRLFRKAGETVPTPTGPSAAPQGGLAGAPAPDEAKLRYQFYAMQRPAADGESAAPSAPAGTDQGGRAWSMAWADALEQPKAELNTALAKANADLASKDLSAALPPSESEVRLRTELSSARDTLDKAKVVERYDNATTALNFGSNRSSDRTAHGGAPVEKAAALTNSNLGNLGLMAAGKPAPAGPVTAEALKGVAVAEEPPVVRRNLPPPEPQPEVACAQNPFSTFSLNVTDVSFKLAAASLEQGQMPDPATVRSEEFLNAFNYHDPAPAPDAPVAFAWERAQYPFAQNRDVLRFAVQTAARGREAARPLNLVLLLDNSGSMERADRVQIIHEALGVLASQLQPNDTVSVVAFARTARLWIDGLSGKDANQLAGQVGNLTPDGGTNLEDALNLAYETALRHFLSQGVNRVVLLTDGAANLGDVDPESLRRKVESYRKRGVALDCFGIGWEGYNDDLLEVLSRNGDGRYGFVNTPEEATTEFAAQLTGAFQVAAADVKVQVEFNARRVTAWRQIGYAKHQLTKEQFRDNTVDAAELAAAESGNALYVVEVNPNGDGDLATVRVRYREPATGVYRELEWPVPYTGPAVALDQASPSLRLATVASAFAEWLVSSPFAGEVTTDALLTDLRGVPEAFAPDPRPTKLEWMIRQAKSLSGK